MTLKIIFWNAHTLKKTKYLFLKNTFSGDTIFGIAESSPSLTTQQSFTHNSTHNSTNSLTFLYSQHIHLLHTHTDTPHTLHCSFSHHSQPFSILLTHFPNTPTEHVPLLKSFTPLLTPYLSMPVIVMGDFNFTTTPSDSSLPSYAPPSLISAHNSFLSLGFSDPLSSTPNPPFTHFKNLTQQPHPLYNSRRIDRLYTNTPHTLSSLLTINTPTHSDHALPTH